MSLFKNLVVSATLLLTGCKKSESSKTETETKPVIESVAAPVNTPNNYASGINKDDLTVLSKKEIAAVKTALLTALTESIILEQHEDIANAQGFNQFAKEDAISQQNLEASLRFLGDFANEKNLYDPTKQRALISVDTANSAIGTNIKLYQLIANELHAEQEKQYSEQLGR